MFHVRIPKRYEYDEQWKDLLVYYKDDIITYDSIGNPLRYRDGMTMTWTNGRQLSSITGLTDNVSYEYDGDGYRKYKTVGTETKIMYSYVGGVLRSQKSADREMLYFYDEKGTIAGVKVIEDGAETIYYYQLNIQGDVIGIINEDGVQVVAYTYDEWGNVLSITGSESTGIGELNPIRYRGYYYDSESGFYYLLSRYYDPETGRFINADDYGYLGASGTLLGYNLFAYCENNPVYNFDPKGCAKTYVFYYNNKGSGFYTQAMNSPYYKVGGKNVYMKRVTYAQEFINAWNSMSGSIDYIYLYLHGGKGVLYFKGQTLGFSGQKSFISLRSKKVNKRVYLFSCKGGAGTTNNCVAWLLARLTSSKVYACTGSVSFSKFGKRYYARKAADWGVIKTFYYQKKYIYWGPLVAKSRIGQW